ncbi:F-box protein At3g07870-like [Papaver somniferum]|uniref:F-box protein At3g07870-like n=1 Tax=Papaver somniferum TaxID=3469 RepID=UPI000E703DF7|nr:F-box protein At3g07870-like [Papaver somniferum]
MAKRRNRLKSLPQEITWNIFSRLPVESVLNCKLVCRSWRELLQFRAIKNYFAYQHLQRQHGLGPHILVQQQQQQHKPFEHHHYGSDSETMSFVAFDIYAQVFLYLEYHDDDDHGISKKKIIMKFPIGASGVVGSENGLGCLKARTRYNGIPEYMRPDEPLNICNPITREFVTLPRILIDEKKTIDGVHIVYGFGYHPFINEYKVVRICYIGDEKSPSFEGKVEVYTLGSGSGWRNVGETKYFLGRRVGGNKSGVCVNGALHWLCDDSANILAFDLVHEEFHLLPTPIKQKFFFGRIFVARRCLFLEYYDDGHSEKLCFLKKNNHEDDDNDSSCHMNEQYYKSWSWNRELICHYKNGWNFINKWSGSPSAF